ncbi:Rgp1-domain-containing protein [Amylocarpus encephaloides]|uniref:Rgp1-domain-containing protein n=1 Tax=Amylocarpus encephaloides TaxID=45428 RepID=A0A9P7YBH9_9HELO|nr:Rgp1-domain-containing protein [Amylocarpus encephaloides]
MSTPLSNVRVFVQWKEATVFAGEDVECEITFKNIATTPTSSRTSLHPSSATANSVSPRGDRPRKAVPTQPKNGSASPRPRPPKINRGHKATLSLNVPSSSARSQHTSDPWDGAPASAVKEAKGHNRSVSIISIGASESSIIGETTGNGNSVDRPRILKGHARSSSLQIVPRRNGVNRGPPSAPLGMRSSTHPSPLLVSSFSPLPRDHHPSELNTQRQSGVQTAPSTPNLSTSPNERRKPSGSFAHGFKFPSIPSERGSGEGVGNSLEDQLISPRTKGPSLGTPNQPTPVARVISPSSVLGTPRSSGEFYSVSNNSAETLASEYVPPQGGRIPPYTGHLRKPSNLAPLNHHRPPETLMMGYAQLHGSFTLDGSLVSQAPFEEVKRKGAVGGQGGGVIGVESKRDSGILKSFGWGNFGESIGGLLGGGELSSMKDMRGIASTRAIPLLSTPQSILFVDLRLGPGESKSYKYTFKLPRGLPPSHRGKAIKTSYKLVIGTQRPGGSKEQQVNSVEVPFRILGSVNSHGELLGHDLMSPYIILRDQARIKAVDSPPASSPDSMKRLQVTQVTTSAKASESTLSDFLSYVDELLERPRDNYGASLLSPTERRDHRLSSIEEPATAKDAIDMAILRSNTATESQQSANRFEIARSGKRVAVIILARPAYRLGEAITAAIEFTDADIPTYAVHMSLESSEKVDPSIALRSEASILRVTRKVYVSHSESTLFARRVVFSPTIPVSATPEFITTGVSLDWRVRIEFVTPRLAFEDNEIMAMKEDLLEEISRDDRGVTLVSAEVLECESFEIAVPIRVYGALAGNTERDESLTDGLVV